jgi:hypothetical protein
MTRRITRRSTNDFSARIDFPGGNRAVPESVDFVESLPPTEVGTVNQVQAREIISRL